MPDAPQPTKPASSLEYDRSVNASLSLRRYRMLMGLTLLNTFMLAALFAGPYLMPFLRDQWQKWQAERELERERQRLVALVRQCQTHSAAPDRVVYEEDPAAAQKLLAIPNGAYEPVMTGIDPNNRTRRRRGGGGGGGGGASAPLAPPGYQPPVRAAVPDYVKEFLDFAGPGGGGGRLFGGGLVGQSESALLFLHERVAPTGERFTVGVWFEPGYQLGSNQTQTDDGNNYVQYGMTKHRHLQARAWTTNPPPPDPPQLVHEWQMLLALPDRDVPDLARVPETDPADAGAAPGAVPDAADAAADGGPATRPVRINYGRTIRFFAGQPDPADGSHFTIDYQLDGKRGTIDGHVRADGITLRPRQGAPAGAAVLQNQRDLGQSMDEAWDLDAPPPASRPARPPRDPSP